MRCRFFFHFSSSLTLPRPALSTCRFCTWISKQKLRARTFTSYINLRLKLQRDVKCSSCYQTALPHLKLIPICDILFLFSRFFCCFCMKHETNGNNDNEDPKIWVNIVISINKSKKNEQTHRESKGDLRLCTERNTQMEASTWRFCCAAAYSLICQLSHTNSLVISTLKARMKKNWTRTIFFSREWEREISQQVHITVVLLCSIYASAFFVVFLNFASLFSEKKKKINLSSSSLIQFKKSFYRSQNYSIWMNYF